MGHVDQEDQETIQKGEVGQCPLLVHLQELLPMTQQQLVHPMRDQLHQQGLEILLRESLHHLLHLREQGQDLLIRPLLDSLGQVDREHLAVEQLLLVSTVV